jgi:putative transposase
MALWTRRKDGITDLAGLVDHNDAGSKYTSIAFSQGLIDEGVDASVGSMGDAYTPWPSPTWPSTRAS